MTSKRSECKFQVVYGSSLSSPCHGSHGSSLGRERDHSPERQSFLHSSSSLVVRIDRLAHNPVCISWSPSLHHVHPGGAPRESQGGTVRTLCTRAILGAMMSANGVTCALN